MTITEVSQALGIPKPTLYQWLREGQFVASGGVLEIPQSEVERLRGRIQRTNKKVGKSKEGR